VNRVVSAWNRRRGRARRFVNDFAWLTLGTPPAPSPGQQSTHSQEERMTRTIGLALALVTLLMTTTAATAAPPDEVNAPRSQEVQAD
jgi:hypothetical protein